MKSHCPDCRKENTLHSRPEFGDDVLICSHCNCAVQVSTHEEGSRDVGGIFILLLFAFIGIGASFADLEGLMIHRGPPIAFIKGFGILITVVSLVFATKMIIKK
jgi:uncharacterized membrane protein